MTFSCLIVGCVAHLKTDPNWNIVGHQLDKVVQVYSALKMMMAQSAPETILAIVHLKEWLIIGQCKEPQRRGGMLRAPHFISLLVGQQPVVFSLAQSIGNETELFLSISYAQFFANLYINQTRETEAFYSFIFICSQAVFECDSSLSCEDWCTSHLLSHRRRAVEGTFQ